SPGSRIQAASAPPLSRASRCRRHRGSGQNRTEPIRGDARGPWAPSKPLQEGGGGRGRERASTSLHLFGPQHQKRHPARLAHGCSCLFFPFTEGTFSILSKRCSRASTCFDQKRRKGTSHASSSMSGSGLSR